MLGDLVEQADKLTRDVEESLQPPAREVVSILGFNEDAAKKAPICTQCGHTTLLCDCRDDGPEEEPEEDGWDNGWNDNGYDNPYDDPGKPGNEPIGEPTGTEPIEEPGYMMLVPWEDKPPLAAQFDTQALDLKPKMSAPANNLFAKPVAARFVA